MSALEKYNAIGTVLNVDSVDDLSELAHEASMSHLTRPGRQSGQSDGKEVDMMPPEGYLACLLNVLAHSRHLDIALCRLIAHLEGNEDRRPLLEFLTDGNDYEYTFTTLKALSWTVRETLKEGEDALFDEGRETLDRLVPEYSR